MTTSSAIQSTLAASSIDSSLHVARIPAFTDNYLWVIHDAASAVVVDPGDATPIIDYLAAHSLNLTAILTTHHHPDHVGGIGALLEWCGASTPVYGPANEVIPHRTHIIGENDTLSSTAPVLDFQVMAVPGHTVGHVAYYAPQHGWLFCGDTLFAGGCGRLLGGTATQMQASLARLASMPDNTLVFCAHEYTLANLKFAIAVEPNNATLRERVKVESAKRAVGDATVPTTIGVERATNPFLRWDSEEVKLAAAQASTGTIAPNASPDIVFGAIREWKNRF
jgi:hydroxyacylglutathione hydrolase